MTPRLYTLEPGFKALVGERKRLSNGLKNTTNTRKYKKINHREKKGKNMTLCAKTAEVFFPADRCCKQFSVYLCVHVSFLSYIESTIMQKKPMQNTSLTWTCLKRFFSAIRFFLLPSDKIHWDQFKSRANTELSG